MSKEDKLAKLVRTGSFPLGTSPVSTSVVAYDRGEELTLYWDKPYGRGYTTNYLGIPHENIPELVEVLLSLYNRDRKKRTEQKAAS